MDTCAGCAHWIVANKTIYESGDVIVHYEAKPGFGGCTVLDIETKDDFGCKKFAAGDDHVTADRKAGAPWQYSRSGPCPDCAAHGNANDGACHRCAGTGQVRHYDDGYVGEERTRLHPKEKESAARPTCSACFREVDADWVSCPRCGQRLNAPADVEKVADPLFAG